MILEWQVWILTKKIAHFIMGLWSDYPHLWLPIGIFLMPVYEFAFIKLDSIRSISEAWSFYLFKCRLASSLTAVIAALICHEPRLNPKAPRCADKIEVQLEHKIRLYLGALATPYLRFMRQENSLLNLCKYACLNLSMLKINTGTPSW